MSKDTKLKKSMMLRRIDSFLKQRRKSDGGWAPVFSADLTYLNHIIEDLIMLKWEADADGDHPIDFTVVDRTRFEPMHYFPLPYLHKVKSDKAGLAAYVNKATFNVKRAMEVLGQALDAGVNRIFDDH